MRVLMKMLPLSDEMVLNIIPHDVSSQDREGGDDKSEETSSVWKLPKRSLCLLLTNFDVNGDMKTMIKRIHNAVKNVHYPTKNH